MSRRLFSRRGLLAAASLLWLGRSARADRLDKGIGGTGVAPDPEEPKRDRGIGGTGVVGTISNLDAMIVNGVRIMHPARFSVVIDGVSKPASSLRVGHTASLMGVKRDGAVETRRVDVSSEVVGPVQSVAPDGLVVMGQRVLLAKPGAWKVGDRVAASGLRRADGAIQAGLIEARPGGTARVVGPVARGDGKPTIGNLELTGFPDALIRQRCIVEGRFDGTVLAVAKARRERDVLLAGHPSELLIEAFVRRNGAYVALGSGLTVDGSITGQPLPDSGETRAVVTLAVTPSGELSVRSIQPERGGGSRNEAHPAPSTGLGHRDNRGGPVGGPSSGPARGGGPGGRGQGSR